MTAQTMPAFIEAVEKTNDDGETFEQFRLHLNKMEVGDSVEVTLNSDPGNWIEYESKYPSDPKVPESNYLGFFTTEIDGEQVEVSAFVTPKMRSDSGIGINLQDEFFGYSKKVGQGTLSQDARSEGEMLRITREEKITKTGSYKGKPYGVFIVESLGFRTAE